VLNYLDHNRFHGVCKSLELNRSKGRCIGDLDIGVAGTDVTVNKQLFFIEWILNDAL